MGLFEGTFQFDQEEPPEPDYTNMEPWSLTFNNAGRGGQSLVFGLKIGWQTGRKCWAIALPLLGKAELQALGNSAKEEEVLKQLHNKRAKLDSLVANSGRSRS
uniref:Uncharacterized protein n=1 Tax=Bionectria ochroleuca TaxID=29856 RepID=A0A8H7TNK3_BIOOC